MGRADQRTNVLGMFIDPLQVNSVLKSHLAVANMWLVIGEESGLDTSILRCETAQVVGGLAEKITLEFQEKCKVRATIELVD